MAKDLASAEKYALLGEKESALLQGWRRPIVLLPDRGSLPEEINRGLGKTGVMLPYMPFHHLLFQNLKTDCIVATSGNFSDEPILRDNTAALDQLLPKTACVVTYNREIHNRCDDSVTFVTNGRTRLIRRSRGWAPRSILLREKCDGIVAVGGELKNTFCLGKGYKGILSQHIGDLKSLETEGFFRESIDRLCGLFGVRPRKVVHDLHPDYLSTRFARDTGLPALGVQHHWAHVASCMAENGITEKVIGFAFDGTGYGTDGAVWGGEILICDFRGFERYGHLQYLPLPGGDAAVKEPWRMGLSYLHQAFGGNVPRPSLPFLSRIPEEHIELVSGMIKNRINSPATSSMGRLFDAVAALTDTCTHSGFEAEAAMRLESLIRKDTTDEEFYPFLFEDQIDVAPVIRRIVEDVGHGMDPSVISRKFHHTVAEIVLAAAEKIDRERNIRTVVLSGGVFYNGYLLALVESRLAEAGFQVYSHSQVPSGDGGLALGQCAIAAASE